MRAQNNVIEKVNMIFKHIHQCFFNPPECKCLPLGETTLITKDKILETLPLGLINLSDLEAASMIHFYILLD